MKDREQKKRSVNICSELDRLEVKRAAEKAESERSRNVGMMIGRRKSLGLEGAVLASQTPAKELESWEKV